MFRSEPLCVLCLSLGVGVVFGSECAPKYHYGRDDYDYSTREVVLSARGDSVSGWTDFSIGEVYRNTRLLHIDHGLALRKAHDSGGYRWCPKERDAFANDTENLVITYWRLNLEKGSDGPEDWLTDTDQELSDSRVCRYLRKFISVKVR